MPVSHCLSVSLHLCLTVSVSHYICVLLCLCLTVSLLLRQARLFTVVYCSGAFLIDEIPGYAQSDLVHDQVVALDTGAHVFVWVGSDAMDVTKQEAVGFAEKYARTAPGRTPLVVLVEHGQEPIAFADQFLAWQPMKVFEDPYKKRKRLADQKYKKEIELKGAAMTRAAACTVRGSGLDDGAEQAGWMGSPYTCSVQAHTGSGDKCTSGGDAFVATLESEELFRPLQATVVDLGDGSYSVSVVPSVWGQCDLNIWCNEDDPVTGGTKLAAVAGSPFDLWIEEGETVQASSCTVVGPGSKQCSAGEEAQFNIDMLSNTNLQNGASVGWESKLELREYFGNRFMQTAAAQVVQVAAVPVRVKHMKQGHFSCNYTVMKPGEYALTVGIICAAAAADGSLLQVCTASGEHLPGSPFAVSCRDAHYASRCALDASVCELTGCIRCIQGQCRTWIWIDLSSSRATS